MTFPGFDPVAIAIGPIAIRWYALSYIAGIFGAWWYVRFMIRRSAADTMWITGQQLESLVSWVTLGIIVGGRLGYVFFYKPLYFFAKPIEILFLWQGGMSFHGGLLGVISATVLFARYHDLSILSLGDLLGCAAPLGLMLGRVGNFVNGELYGRPAPSSLPWAMDFPGAGLLPRHPSQLYEALFEGVVLLSLLHLLWRVRVIRTQRGVLFGCFLVGYGLARTVIEFFREPDTHLGLLLGGVTMGQWLSLPMIISGSLLLLLIWHYHN